MLKCCLDPHHTARNNILVRKKYFVSIKDVSEVFIFVNIFK